MQIEAALNNYFRILAHWIFFRDILYKKINIQKNLDAFVTIFRDLVCTGQF